MATTVPNNPFDTQQPAATNTNITGSSNATIPAAPTPAAGTGIVGSTMSGPNTGILAQQPTTSGALPANVGTSTAPTNNQAATMAPVTRQVNAPTDTVAGQVDSILAKDSPLMQRARTLATQQMSQRGLVNSSMAQGAGVAAMTDRALPIAQQDAETFNRTASENMSAANQAGQFNAGELNRFGLQRNEQQFQAGEASITRDYNKQMAQLQESGLDFRQARDIASREALTKLEQAGVTNRFDKELALKSDMFNVEQVNADRRQIQQNDFELKKLGVQINADKQNIPTNFAANISNTTMNGVNAIMADGNMSPDAKRGAINNLVTYANSQISWASTFYGTAIPALRTP
jgi:hypothetical protein